VHVYLHDERRNQYYAGVNTWVADPKNGLQFQTIEQALHAKDQDNLSTADLVVIGDDPSLVVRLGASVIRPIFGT